MPSGGFSVEGVSGQGFQVSVGFAGRRKGRRHSRLQDGVGRGAVRKEWDVLCLSSLLPTRDRALFSLLLPTRPRHRFIILFPFSTEAPTDRGTWLEAAALCCSNSRPPPTPPLGKARVRVAVVSSPGSEERQVCRVPSSPSLRPGPRSTPSVQPHRHGPACCPHLPVAKRDSLRWHSRDGHPGTAGPGWSSRHLGGGPGPPPPGVRSPVLRAGLSTQQVSAHFPAPWPRP